MCSFRNNPHFSYTPRNAYVDQPTTTTSTNQHCTPPQQLQLLWIQLWEMRVGQGSEARRFSLREAINATNERKWCLKSCIPATKRWNWLVGGRGKGGSLCREEYCTYIANRPTIKSDGSANARATAHKNVALDSSWIFSEFLLSSIVAVGGQHSPIKYSYLHYYYWIPDTCWKIFPHTMNNNINLKHNKAKNDNGDDDDGADDGQSSNRSG